MDNTQRLGLPLIAGEQAQKHITHNEAIAIVDGLLHLTLEGRDVTSPPGDPEPGQSFGVGAQADGAWAGMEGMVAHWSAGGWRFTEPVEGMIAWDRGAQALLVFSAGAWQATAGAVDVLGVNTTADETNRLAVRSEAALFTAITPGDGGNGNVRLTLNKNDSDKSATLLFQSGFSGRAEIGLAGNDDFAFKVSADGEDFETALSLTGDGFVRADGMFGAAVSVPVILDGVVSAITSCVAPVPQVGVSADIVAIAGGFDGALLVVMGSSGTTLTLRDGTGNLSLGSDRVLSGAGDVAMLVRRDGSWFAVT
jgi:hypothetical protein